MRQMIMVGLPGHCRFNSWPSFQHSLATSSLPNLSNRPGSRSCAKPTPFTPTPLIISLHHMCASAQMCTCCLEVLHPIHSISQRCKQSISMFLCRHSASLRKEESGGEGGGLHSRCLKSLPCSLLAVLAECHIHMYNIFPGSFSPHVLAA